MRIASITVVASLLVACHGSTEIKAGGGAAKIASGAPARVDLGPPPAPPPGALSVTSFGARGDGVTDDRVAVQAALDAASAAGGELYFPPGTYALSPAPRGYFAVEVRGKVHLRGAGQDRTVLQQTRGTGPSVRLMNVSGEGVVIEDLTLDGNRAVLPANEQRHGIFASNTDGLVVQHVTARNFTGDGFYLYNGARNSHFSEVLATGNGRNGLTMGGMVDGTMIVDSRFVANVAQQVDSEPGGDAVVSNTTITGSLLDPGTVSKQFVLTCSGTRANNPGHDWKVVGNTINGGVFIVWAEHVVIAGNTGVNQTPLSYITVERSSSDIMILGNRFKQAQQQVPSLSGILVVGTAGSGPERVLIAGNDIEMSYERSYGVRATGAVSVEISGNVLRGAHRAAPGYAGIHLRATKLDQDFRSAVVRGNTIRDFGDRGVNVVGNGQAKLLSVDISDNTFSDDSQTPAMTTGISLDDGTGAVQRAQLDNNKYIGGVKDGLINVPAHAMRAPGSP